MSMCFLGDRKEAEVVQLIWVHGKGNIYQRQRMKHYDAECYGFITEEETIQSYKTQCTSLLTIHKIKHHSPNSLQQFQYHIFSLLGLTDFFQGKQHLFLTQGGGNHALQ